MASANNTNLNKVQARQQFNKQQYQARQDLESSKCFNFHQGKAFISGKNNKELSVDGQYYLSNGQLVVITNTTTSGQYKSQKNIAYQMDHKVKKKLELSAKLWARQLQKITTKSTDKKFYKWRYWVGCLQSDLVGENLYIVSNSLLATPEAEATFIEYVNRIFLDGDLWGSYGDTDEIKSGGW
jgi:hypothetical protein